MSGLPSQKVAIYARVSTLVGQDPEMQLAELRDYASRRGWLIYHEYTDHGVSGAQSSRPQLNRLLKDAHERRFDVLLVWKMDRLSRSLRDLVNTLATLESYGIAFVSLRDALDFSTASGRLLAHIIGAMAEFERALIQERVRAGLEHAKARGQRLGRPRRAVDKDVVAEMRAKGASLRSIASVLKIGYGTVRKRLREAELKTQ